MAFGWYFAPYRLRPAFGTMTRYCGMDDFTPQINADGGAWAEIECLGPGPGMTVVKVRASAATLTAIAADPEIMRIPVARLDDPLSTLTATQKNAAIAKLQALGYTLAEVQAALPGNLGTHTLRDVLRVALTRRRDAHYDAPSSTIVCDGPIVACDPVEQADEQVR